MSIFSIRLLELRKEFHYTQKQLAALIDSNNSSVCDWEKGRSEPCISAIIRLCILFNVTSDYLIGLTDY